MAIIYCVSFDPYRIVMQVVAKCEVLKLVSVFFSQTDGSKLHSRDELVFGQCKFNPVKTTKG